MSWTVKIEVVAEEEADSIIELLKEAEDVVELTFAFNTSKINNDVALGLENVQAYFNSALSEYGSNVSNNDIRGGEEMPIESVCGNDCKCAIDAAAEFCKHIKLACAGPANTHLEAAIEAAWEVCEIYING